MTPEETEKIYRIFLAWYAMPKASRIPMEIDEFCAKFGIDKALLSEFQHRPEYTEDLYKASMSWGKSKIPELLHILYGRYKESHSPNDLKLYTSLLQLDKPSKKDSDEGSNRSGVLRELFEASRK